MQVKDYMHPEVITVSPADRVSTAYQRMREHKIRHLPVVGDSQRLVGLLTDRDVRKAGASDDAQLAAYDLSYLLEKMTVDDIMTHHVVTVTGETLLAEASQVFVDKKFGCLPVVGPQQRLEGILTVTDLLRAYVHYHQSKREQ
jgi:acetoin utilization protein AcuB